MSQLPAPSLIAELEVRQDEALQSLVELEERIASALAEFGGVSPASVKAVKPSRKASGNLPEEPEQGNAKLKIHRPAAEPVCEEDSAAA